MPSAAIVIASPSRATTAPETLVRYAGEKIRTRLPTATVIGGAVVSWADVPEDAASIANAARRTALLLVMSASLIEPHSSVRRRPGGRPLGRFCRWHTVIAVALVAAGCAPRKKLIEFGWDEPDASFMRAHIEEMERAPFDGCVYHVSYARAGGPGPFAWEAWGRRAFTPAELDGARRDLRATRFRRFRYNFLRLNVTPGDLDWFDDYDAVRANARLAASLAREGRSRGVLLDTETYNAPLFWY